MIDPPIPVPGSLAVWIIETMFVGGWKIAHMVTHCSTGATAEHGVVAKYV